MIYFIYREARLHPTVLGSTLFDSRLAEMKSVTKGEELIPVSVPMVRKEWKCFHYSGGCGSVSLNLLTGGTFFEKDILKSTGGSDGIYRFAHRMRL